MLLSKYDEDAEHKLFARAMQDVGKELKDATDRYGSFHSTHEAAGVLREEHDEFWDAIKANDTAAARAEAVQVAAMAIRFIIDADRGEKCII